jgi:NADPH:quinone reductase-like Zn-dependent oxidoreductase/ubiquinone/menaquinone biosynthesis C-methylase UbiE
MTAFAPSYLEALQPRLCHFKESRDVRPVRFFSSVTGAEIPLGELTKPEYWVANMTSPVKFDAAMRSLLSEMGPTGKDLRAVIELGPHKALVNAVKDLISEKSPSSTWIYDPTLTRGNDGCSDLMDLAANLMAKGYHLDVAKIEAGSTGQKPATCLTDLPSYPFNLSRRYWHESRFADGPEKDSSPWQCLLGHKLPAVPGVELQCRNVFTLDDIPWLRDHVVNSQIVFPLAGYVCAVVEALQLLGDTAKSAHGFKLRNLVVGKAFVLSENQEHELFTTLKRATDSSESTSLTGTFDFQVSSWTSTGKFVEHCAGQASLDFESTGDDSLEIAHDRAGLAHELSRVREVACRDFGPQQLYEGTNRCGLAYGPHFRRVTSFKTCGDSAFGEVTVGDTSSCLPGEYEGHMTIHPTVLDAALHVGLTHLGDNRGDPTSMRAHVPVYFEELYVSSAISHQPGQVFEVYAYGPSADRRQRSTTGNMAMCEPGNDELLVNIRNMRLVDVHEDNDQARSEDMINPHKISWITHPLLNPLTERETKASPAEVAEYELLTQLSHFFVREALSRNDARPLSKPYMRNLISWMERIVSTGVDEKTVSFLATAREMPFAERERWFNQLVKDSVSAEFIIKAGRALPDVLYNDREPLEALLEDDCLYRLYDNSALFKTSRTCMSNLVDSLAYLNPSMKILEVGAGTGGFTSGVLEALTSETGSSRFEHYEYTDVSAGFFPKVKEKLQPWSSKMGFKKLDLAADVAQQGFEPEQYDLVIGALVVHATPDIEQSLKNIRRLLKPGGMIALVELCDNQQTNAGFLPFGMLPDWWLNGETGPWLTRKAWQDVVRRAGFAEIGDFWQDETANCVFWAHRDPPIASPLAPVAVVVDREPATLAETVQTHLSETLKSPVQLLTPAEAVDFDGNLICLEHPDGLSLYQWEQAQFDQAKAVILSSKNVLWVTTNEERQHRNALSAFALGVGRQIRNENASINFAVLQLDTASDGACAQVIGVVCEDTFVRCADLPNPEVEFRQRSGRIEIPRVLPARAVYANLAGRLNSGDAHSVPIDQEGTCLRATCRQPGLLNTLYFESSPACDISGEPDEDEVFIDVHATGLNFKDVVIALGRVPWEELGKECSGVVRTVGKRAAERYSPGDRVVHWGEGLFAAHARCHTSRLAKIPDGLSMEEAASLPLVFATAYECLVRVARLQKGEKVLIHAASGGVGQAAVMLAQQLGAEVFITVSTDEKKHLVCSTYGVPESHVYSSRKPESIERLARATGGVDVVLSSLSGDMVKASWKCLGIQGRFVDIGKRDALSNANLEMSPFARGASYVAVDLSLLIEHKPQYAQQLLEEVLDQAGRGVVRTVKPIMLKPIDQLEEALRFMQAGKHTGKIVIQIKKAAEVMVKQSPSMTKEFNSDATYVITGGTGGLGRAMVTWLAEHGAKNIAVLSRSGEAAMRSARWAVAAERVQSFGARIFPCKCDVGDIDSLRTALRGLDEQGAPPVKGVIHGAMVLRVSPL